MDARGEGNGRDLAAGYIQPPQLPSLRDHDRRAVGSPRVAGQHADRLHPLGHVLRDRVHDDPLGARLQVADPQRGAGAELVALPLDRGVGKAAREGDVATVRSDLGRKAATARQPVLPRGHATGDLHHFTRLQVHAAQVHGALEGIPHEPVVQQSAVNVVHRPRHRLSRRAHVVEDVPPVFGHRRPRRRAVVAGHNLDARAAVLMVHPDLAALRHQDVLAVGGPFGHRHAGVHAGLHLARVRPVRVHDPEVGLAGPVRDERDARAVGGVFGVVVDRDAAHLREALGLPALRGDAVDVREEIEDDPPSVGRHVHRHPGPLVGLEVDFAGVAPRERDVPVGVIGAVRGARVLCKRGGGEGGGGGPKSEGDRKGNDGCGARHGCLRGWSGAVGHPVRIGSGGAAGHCTAREGAPGKLPRQDSNLRPDG